MKPSVSALFLFALLGSWSLHAQDKIASTYEGAETIASMTLAVDVSCILRTWRITGVMVCPSPAGGVTACVIVENAYPVGILEAVRRPMTSHLAEVSALTKSVEDVRLFGQTSSHTTSSADGTGLQFTEAHVYEFVPSLPAVAQMLPIVVPQGQLFSVSYFSELDGYFWRTGFAEMLLDPAATVQKAVLPSCSTMPRTTDCAWSWGSWFPRIGFTVHPSEVMTAHLEVLRGGRVGAKPVGRVVMAPYPYEPRTGHYIQMVRPARRACISIGWPVTRSIESGTLSREGAYLFIHFGIFRECKGCLPPTLVEPRIPSF